MPPLVVVVLLVLVVLVLLLHGLSPVTSRGLRAEREKKRFMDTMWTCCHPWCVLLSWFLLNLAERASAGLNMKVEFLNEAGGT